MVHDEVFRSNAAQDGGALALEGGAGDTLVRCAFFANVADKDSLGEGAGGACLVNGAGSLAQIGRPGEPNRFSYNTAAYGGALAVRQMAEAVVQHDTFTANQAGYFSGEGDGGALFVASGASVQLGGNAPDGQGNYLDQNVAGRPAFPGLANGGALALHGPASMKVEGNVFRNHNACTHNGGAIYLRGEGGWATIGGHNDDAIIHHPFADTMLGNIVQNNNYGFVHAVTLPQIPWPQDSLVLEDTLELDSLVPVPVFPDTLVPDTDIIIITYDPVSALELDLSSPMQRIAWVTQGEQGLLCVDVSFPGLFVVLDTLPSLGYAMDLAIGPGLVLYLADGDGGVQVIDAGALHAGLPPLVLDTLAFGTAVTGVDALNGYLVALGADSSAHLLSLGAAGYQRIDTLNLSGLEPIMGVADPVHQRYVLACGNGPFSEIRSYAITPLGFLPLGMTALDGRVSDMELSDSLLLVTSNFLQADTNTAMVRAFSLASSGAISDYPFFPVLMEKGEYYTCVEAEWPEVFIGCNSGQITLDALNFSMMFQPTHRPVLDVAPTTLTSTTVACGNPALMTLSPPAGGMMGELPGAYTTDSLSLPWPADYPLPVDSTWMWPLPALPDSISIEGSVFHFGEDSVWKGLALPLPPMTASGQAGMKALPDTFLPAVEDSILTMNGGFLAVVDSAETLTLGNLIGGPDWRDANTARGFGGGIYVRNAGDTVFIGDHGADSSVNRVIRNYLLGNVGRWGGGVAAEDHGTHTLRLVNNVIGGLQPLEGNLARSRGGGVYAQSSGLLLRYNEIMGNSAGFDTASVDTVYGFGGGLALMACKARVTDNWVVGNRSTGNAGGTGLMLGGGEVRLERNTLTENNGLMNSLPRGVVVYGRMAYDQFTEGLGDEIFIGKPVGGPLGDSCLVRHNVIDHFGSFEASGLYADTLLREDSLLIRVEGNLMRSVIGKVAGGAWKEDALMQGNLRAIPVFSAPDSGNYSLALTYPLQGVGWNPSPTASLWGDAMLEVPVTYATISQALAAARPGDRILVSPAYTGDGEAFPLNIPSGVLLTGTAFGDTLNLEMTDSTRVVDTTGGVVLRIKDSGGRTLVAGLSFIGKDSVLHLRNARGYLAGCILASSDSAINLWELEELSPFGFHSRLLFDHNTFLAPLWVHYRNLGAHADIYSDGDLSRPLPGPMLGYNILEMNLYANDTLLPALAQGEEMNDRYALQAVPLPSGMTGLEPQHAVASTRRHLASDPLFSAPGQHDYRLLRTSPCLLGLDSVYCVIQEGECLFGFDSVCTCEHVVIQGQDTLVLVDTFYHCRYGWDSTLYSRVVGAQYASLEAVLKADTDFLCLPATVNLWVEEVYAAPADTLTHTWFLSTGDTLEGDSLSVNLQQAGVLGALLRASNRYSVMHFRADSLLLASRVGVYAGSDSLIADTQSVVLNPLVSGGVGPLNYDWSPGEGLSDTVIASPLAHPWRTTVYRLEVMDSLGCSGSDQLTLTVTPTLAHISGQVHYLNGVETPLAYAGVILCDSLGVALDTLWTGPEGRYLAGYLNPGEYVLRPLVSAPWGGGNATDALLVLRHFVQLDTLTGLLLTAADVDASLTTNTTDAMLIARRFASIIHDFAGGDWVLDGVRLKVAAGYYVLRLPVVCFGDVNGSHELNTGALRP